LQNFSKCLFLLVILLNSALQTVILHVLHGDEYLESRQIGKIVLLGVLEYITLFIGYLAVIVTDSEQRRQLSLAANKFRLYLALSFPEVLMKMIAISLQLFDCEPTVLFLLAVLIISIQNFSMGWVTTLSPSKLIVGTMISILLKLGLRMMAYPPSDVWMMGILL
jgi:membrane-associated HD superfamily phosphohydrolase